MNADLERIREALEVSTREISFDTITSAREALQLFDELFAGKVLVPVEPTNEMVDALYPGTGAHTCRDLYQAMLAASQEQVSATAREVGE